MQNPRKHMLKKRFVLHSSIPIGEKWSIRPFHSSKSLAKSTRSPVYMTVFFSTPSSWFVLFSTCCFACLYFLATHQSYSTCEQRDRGRTKSRDRSRWVCRHAFLLHSKLNTISSKAISIHLSFASLIIKAAIFWKESGTLSSSCHCVIRKEQLDQATSVVW